MTAAARANPTRPRRGLVSDVGKPAATSAVPAANPSETIVIASPPTNQAVSNAAKTTAAPMPIHCGRACASCSGSIGATTLAFLEAGCGWTAETRLLSDGEIASTEERDALA